MSYQTIKHLSIGTLQREIRNKTLIAILGFTVLIIFLINGGANFIDSHISDPNAGDLNSISGRKFYFFYYIISLWSGILGTLLGINSIMSDSESGVQTQILALPISKIEYIFSRIISSWLIVIGYYVISILVGIIIFLFSTNNLIINPFIIYSFIISSLGILIAVILGTLFSLVFQKIIALMATIGTLMLISLSNNMFLITNSSLGSEQWTTTKLLGLLIHYALPRYGVLNQISSSLLSETTSDHINYFFEIIHYPLSITALFFIIYFIFIKRE